MANYSYGGNTINMDGKKLGRSFGAVFIGLLFLLFLMKSVTVIETGHVGVLTFYGKVTGEVLSEGIHLINPLKSVNKMSVRTTSVKESASVPSSEGLIINLDTSVVYHLKADHAAEVYRTLGLLYQDSFIEPNVRSAVREATA